MKDFQEKKIYQKNTCCPQLCLFAETPTKKRILSVEKLNFRVFLRSETKRTRWFFGFGRWRYRQQTNRSFLQPHFCSRDFSSQQKSPQQNFSCRSRFFKDPVKSTRRKSCRSPVKSPFPSSPQPPVEILCASSASALNVVSPSVKDARSTDSGRFLFGKKTGSSDWLWKRHLEFV